DCSGLDFCGDACGIGCAEDITTHMSPARAIRTRRFAPASPVFSPGWLGVLALVCGALCAFPGIAAALGSGGLGGFSSSGPSSSGSGGGTANAKRQAAAVQLGRAEEQ